jgi:hypothetical protein
MFVFVSVSVVGQWSAIFSFVVNFVSVAYLPLTCRDFIGHLQGRTLFLPHMENISDI